MPRLASALSRFSKRNQQALRDAAGGDVSSSMLQCTGVVYRSSIGKILIERLSQRSEGLTAALASPRRVQGHAVILRGTRIPYDVVIA